MLPKANLTSYSKMSGSRWMITHHHGYLDHKDLFCILLLCIFCHFFLIFSASIRFIVFLSFIEPIFVWHVFLISLIFLKSCLIFPILFLSSISLHCSLREAFFLIFPCYSLVLCIQMGISFLFSFAFHFLLFSAIFKASSDNHFVFLHFFFLGMVLITTPVQCYEPLSVVLQALCALDLIPWICLLLPLYIHMGFDLGHIWMA